MPGLMFGAVDHWFEKSTVQLLVPWYHLICLMMYIMLTIVCPYTWWGTSNIIHTLLEKTGNYGLEMGLFTCKSNGRQQSASPSYYSGFYWGDCLFCLSIAFVCLLKLYFATKMLAHEWVWHAHLCEAKFEKWGNSNTCKALKIFALTQVCFESLPGSLSFTQQLLG